MTEEQTLEVAHIAAIMMSEIDFQSFYEKSAEKEGGFIGSTYLIAQWALEFYEETKNADWSQEDIVWDEQISYFVKSKIYNYGSRASSKII